MKKFFISLLSLLLTLSTVNVIKADSSVIYDELIFDENHKVEDIYPLLPDTKLEYGDTYINKEDIRVALETQNKMNALRTGGERWELARSKPLYDYGDLKCKLLNMVSAGMTESKSSEYTFTISGVVKGYTLTGTFSYTKSYTIAAFYIIQKPRTTDLGIINIHNTILSCHNIAVSFSEFFNISRPTCFPCFSAMEISSSLSSF